MQEDIKEEEEEGTGEIEWTRIKSERYNFHIPPDFSFSFSLFFSLSLFWFLANSSFCLFQENRGNILYDAFNG